MEKNGRCLFILRKNVSDVFFILLYLSFMCVLLFRILIVEKCLVINGIPAISCFISVIWIVCLKDLVRSLFCSIVRVGTRSN